MQSSPLSRTTVGTFSTQSISLATNISTSGTKREKVNSDKQINSDENKLINYLFNDIILIMVHLFN